MAYKEQETQKEMLLEPVVDGKRIPTFRVEEWMFERENSHQ